MCVASRISSQLPSPTQRAHRPITAVSNLVPRFRSPHQQPRPRPLQAIAIAVFYAEEWPLLVVCPTSMSLTWCEELERWCPFLVPGDVNLVRSHHNAELSRAKVTVLTYGLATNGKERDRLLQNVAAAGFRVAIADEAHYLKSKDAQRSKLLLPVLKAARRCVVLTGTPALSRPVELYTLLQCVCPSQPAWRTYTAFTERYCDAKVKFFGRARRVDVSGSSHEPESYARLHTVARWSCEPLPLEPAEPHPRCCGGSRYPG